MDAPITENSEEFPKAVYFPEEAKKRKGHEKALSLLMHHKTRPAPERIRILTAMFSREKNRHSLDRAFALCESVFLPSDPERDGFDPQVPRLDYREVRESLEAVPENREWLARVMERTACRFSLDLPGDIIPAAERLLSFLCREISFWEADAFPLEAMTDMKNRYAGTFRTDAWSLREQLRRESLIIRKAWKVFSRVSARVPLLLIVNECTPSDYMTSLLPSFAEILPDSGIIPHAPVLLHTGLKISSSEHRLPLQETPEGQGLMSAIRLAGRLGRQPVLLDFSRRRFPRSFLRAFRFAKQKGLGIAPMGKVSDCHSRGTPPPKSAQGFYPLRGSPLLRLCDPWPLSDPEILEQMCREKKEKICRIPRSKPWQDDRVGARTEMESNEKGLYRISSQAWVVPALGGWMRADDLFKSRLARMLRR